MSSYVIGVLFALLATFFFGISPLLYRRGLSYGYGILSMNFIRLLYTIPLSFTLTSLLHGLKEPTLLGLLYSLAIAVISTFIADSLFFLALRCTGTSLATAIAYTYPAFTLVFAFFLGEGVVMLQFVAVFTVIVGIWLCLYDENRLVIRGVFYAICSSFFWALGLFLARLSLNYLSVTELVLYRNLFAVLLLCPFAPFSLKVYISRGSMYVALGAICAMVFGLYTYYKALELAGIVTSATVSSAAPIVTLVLSWFLFHEKVSHRKLVGILFVVFGTILISIPRYY